MASIDSSALRRNARTAARSAAEAAIAGALVAGAACAVWRGDGERRGLLIGVGAAWAASSMGTTALLVSKAAGSPKAFWWAFGGGMGARLATLIGLMAYGAWRDDLSQPALLLAYAFGVLFFLMVEYRHIKLK